MIRIIFFLILIFHGFIHLIGFVKEWGLVNIARLDIKTILNVPASTAKVFGILWLLACLAFIAAAILVLEKKPMFWLPAGFGVLISQVLIFFYWHDTKFGIIANVIILLGIVLAIAQWNFNRMVKEEVKSLLTASRNAVSESISERNLKPLPPVVQQWMRTSNAVGKRQVNAVYVKQNGMLRTKPESNWMPFEAEQFFTVNPPGFIWKADINSGPFTIAGRDKYENGKGNMLIKPLYIIPLTNGRGKEIDQGTLLRYLGEISGFPTAVLGDYISWKQLSDTTASATMSYQEVTATGVFSFNKEGDMTSFEAERYGDFNGKYSLEKWRVDASGHKSFNSVRVATHFEVTWKLKEGDFKWLTMDITDVKFDIKD